MISINSNFLQQKLQSALLSHTSSFATSLQRLVTGLKINSPSDDPAGFYVSNNFLTQIRGLESANKNIQSAVNILNLADSSIGDMNNLMTQIRELVSQSCSEYLTPEERQANQEKINQLFSQAQGIKQDIKYNGQSLFNGSVYLDKNATYVNNKLTTSSKTATPASISTASVPAVASYSTPVQSSPASGISVASTLSLTDTNSNISLASVVSEEEPVEYAKTEGNTTSVLESTAAETSKMVGTSLVDGIVPPPPVKCGWQLKFRRISRTEWYKYCIA